MDTKDVKSGRSNLDSSLISRELARRESTWVDLEVHESVTSTNDLVIERLAADSERVHINTADEQTKGRGRLQREWSSPKGAGIALSIGCPIDVFKMEPSTIPLVVGVAVIETLSESGIDTRLKWPNDIVFVSEDGEVRKTGGILLQRTGDSVVIGIGLNVDLTETELPTPTSTSLKLEGFEIPREEIIAGIISNLEELARDSTGKWRGKYLENSATIGSRVRVMLADGSRIEGDATHISDNGGLVVEVDDAAVEVTVGDIEHLRHI